MLCERCQTLQSLRNEPSAISSPRRPYEIKVVTLEASAQAGCSLCALFYNGFAWYSQLLKQTIPDNIALYPSLYGYEPFVAWEEGKDTSTSILEFYALQDSKSQYKCFSIGKHVSQNSESDHCFGLIKSWIQECQSKHTRCAAKSLSRLPTRVIEVGQAGESPKLYVTSGEEAPYVALSHCWGKFEIVTTTQNTIDQRKSGIEWVHLSKTFQDAITITRKLGLQYLWIDSLCIIQDDELDWQIESSKMGQIYRDSYLTIAATLSADGRGGCFSERNAQSEELSDTLDDKLGHNPSGIYVRRKLRDHSVIDPFDKNADGSPLHTRAWAFQERLLSTRVVQYMKDELRWECKSDTKCECGAFDAEAQFGHGDRSFKSYYQESKIGDRQEIRRAWARIVELFLPLDLTYDHDRLPAISAVARDAQSVNTGAYLAGLWEGFLPESLLWSVSFASTRPKEYRAPSWSWSSIESTTIHFFSGYTQIAEQEGISQHDICAKVLEVQCNAAGQNSMGEVQDGYLKISGPVLEPANLIAAYNIRTSYYYRQIPGYPGDFEGDIEVGIFDKSSSWVGDRVLFLKIGNFYVNQETATKWTASLVLVPSHRVENAFERIGMLTHTAAEAGEKFYHGSMETVLTIV